MPDDPVQIDDAAREEAHGAKKRIGILRPLQVRDFRLLWTGMTVSFMGDGIFAVALAWQVYDMSNVPTALSVVAVAWSVPMVIFLLAGGILSDRLDRRIVMIAGDVIRGFCVLGMGVLVVTDVAELWHFIALGAVYGIGQALFNPAFGAVVPDIVPKDMILEANSLDSFVRQAAERLIGPAIGGVMVGALGAGTAFLVDAGSFAFSAVMISLIKQRPRIRAEVEERPLQQIGEGFRFVRSKPWLIATLLSASFTLLFALGPFEILLPFYIKNELNGHAQDVGWVIAAGGIGAIIASVLLAQRGIPRKHVRFMYICWGIGVGSLAGYYFATKLWHAIGLEFVAWFLFTGGQIVWTTLMHRLVPSHLLGRVMSLDWMMSTALIPISFALTGPISQSIGVRETFLWAGILSAAATFLFLLWPGIRNTERDGSIHPLPDREPEAAEGLISA